MTVRNAFRTVIMYSHYGQSLWTVIKTVLFFIMTVQNDCPFCEMKISSHKNVCPLFIVKSEFLGYNGYNVGLTLRDILTYPAWLLLRKTGPPFGPSL